MLFRDLNCDILCMVAAYLPIDSLDAFALTCRASYDACSGTAVLIDALRKQGQFPKNVLTRLVALGTSRYARLRLRHLLDGLDCADEIFARIYHLDRTCRNEVDSEWSDAVGEPTEVDIRIGNLTLLLCCVTSTLAVLGCPRALDLDTAATMVDMSSKHSMIPWVGGYTTSESPLNCYIPFISAIAAVQYRHTLQAAKRAGKYVGDFGSAGHMAFSLNGPLQWWGLSSMACTQVIQRISRGTPDEWEHDPDHLPVMHRMELMEGIEEALPLPEFGDSVLRTYTSSSSTDRAEFEQAYGLGGWVRLEARAAIETGEWFGICNLNTLPSLFQTIHNALLCLDNECLHAPRMGRYLPFWCTDSFVSWYRERSRNVLDSILPTKGSWIGYMTPTDIYCAVGSTRVHAITFDVVRGDEVTGTVTDTGSGITSQFVMTVDRETFKITASQDTDDPGRTSRWLGRITPMGLSGWWLYDGPSSWDMIQSCIMTGPFWFYKAEWTDCNCSPRHGRQVRPDLDLTTAWVLE